MKWKLLQSAVVGCAVCATAGCSNIGNAPAGESPDQVKAEVAKESPEQQIRNVYFAPIPPAQKEEQLKALEDKYHVSREDAIKNLPTPKFDTSTPPPEKPTGK